MRPHRPLRDLGFLDRARATVLLRGDDTEAIVQALVAITLHEPDGAWVETECHRLSSHPDPGVRRMCALGLGHVARVHRALDRGAAEATLTRLASDPDEGVRAVIGDTLDDLEIFLGWRPSIRTGC